MVLNCIETALAKHPRRNHRHRIEHAGITMPDLLARMKASVSSRSRIPPFATNSATATWNTTVTAFSTCIQSEFVDNGMMVAGASDSPVTHCDPLLGITLR